MTIRQLIQHLKQYPYHLFPDHLQTTPKAPSPPAGASLPSATW